MDGTRSTWVTLPLNDDGTLDWPRQLRDYSVSLRLLSYVDDPNQQVRHIPVRAGGTLDRLRRLSEHLAKIYGWRKARATTFLLSDEVPPIPYVHYRIKEHSPWSKARRSVTITAPLWLTPKKMADLYQELRRTALRGEGFPRAVSKKTAELAVFAAQHNQGRTWWETMKLWNDQWGAANPKWEYEDEAQFTRDSREAFKRITGEHLHWDGKKE